MHDLEYLRLLQAAVDQSFDAVVITTAELDRPGPEIVYANPAFLAMTGYELDELLGNSPRLFQGEGTNRQMLDRLRETLAAGERFSARTVNYRKDGSAYDVEWSISPVRGESGDITHFVSVQRDITEETREHERRQMLVYALDASSDSVVITDRENRILDVNRAFEDHTGYSRAEVRGKNPSVLQSGMHDRSFYQRLWDTLQRGEVFRDTFIDKRKNGQLIHMEETITPVRDEHGELTGYVSVGKDITDRVHTENELKRLATTDMLTGLINRMHFEKLLDHEHERVQRYGHPASLIMIDIDHFKQINDDCGHPCGDAVLTRFARLVGEHVRTTDSFARWGGEEFMLITPDTDEAAAMVLAEKLRELVRSSEFPEVGRVTASFGVAALSAELSPEDSVHRVDQRLYTAKRLGRDRVVGPEQPDS
ncbi:diguanylate cyclase [Guyparkeria hydrothermalis]|uniref:sensor domain-containing diguanylate cyclase n=1 Tax=Guyparkeria TaxID=2035712 RepID=UPI0010ACB298|nr:MULTISPECIES: diguanylate cyclase [Guyparkeria]MCL7752093.1 diguanylate cyclase [Guyparkeria hydrothermalis]TKA91290.1 diguanylate cyclase [Guyparkeria sp. SB14A]